MSDTDRYRSLHELDDRQLLALDILLAGGTHEEAAEAAGVTRVTVTRWANRHPAFRAERNRRRQELRAAVDDKIRGLDRAALEVLEAQIAAGDAGAAIDWVRLRGPAALAPAKIGHTTAERIIDHEASTRANEVEQDTINALFGDPLLREYGPDREAIRLTIQDELLKEEHDGQAENDSGEPDK